MWEFFAALEGYADAHNPESSKDLTASEEDELWLWLQGQD